MTGTEEEWTIPSAKPALGGDEVHVWRVSLQRPAAEMDRLAQNLSADEKARAARFVFDIHRQRYIAARGVLRRLLGNYLSLAPEELVITYSDYAKPFLAPGRGYGDLFFNVTHSGELALLAFARGRRLGVDVEYRREVADVEKMAQHYFSPPEVAALQAVPPGERSPAFLQGWTRKEAYIKAIGEGLSRPLDSFDVTLGPGKAAALLTVRDDPAEAARWRLIALNPDPDYIAALVVEGQEWQLSCYEYAEQPL